MKKLIGLALVALCIVAFVTFMNSQNSDPAEDEDAETLFEATELAEKAENNATEGGAAGSAAATQNADFRTAMDDYEKYMDEYIAYMKKFSENPTDPALIGQSGEVMQKYAKVVADFEAWGDKELSSEDLAYYTEVQTRVNKKLLEAGIA
ncbi:MAG: hypothetical protein E7580_07590 [Ruminococcaceae bacterium]|nr:hypothetical protein [Oscillospiraceae bacterium]